MKKEYTIFIDINADQEKMLESIRWKHIDIDRIMQEELTNQSQEIMSFIIEEIYHG